MRLETLKDRGLAHSSYYISDRGVATVIDPRRDIYEYLKMAEEDCAEICYVFETHLNEDYVIGSLAARIGVRKAVLIEELLIGGGGALVSQVQELWQLYLFWGVIAAFGAARVVLPTSPTNRVSPVNTMKGPLRGDSWTA